jgi:hypothetical protein
VPASTSRESVQSAIAVINREKRYINHSLAAVRATARQQSESAVSVVFAFSIVLSLRRDDNVYLFTAAIRIDLHSHLNFTLMLLLMLILKIIRRPPFPTPSTRGTIDPLITPNEMGIPSTVKAVASKEQS